MANNHSAEFLRGAVAALQRRPYSAYTTSVLLAEYQTILAAAEACEKAALGTDWDDPDVQFVYRLLCSNELPGSPEEHWEGKVARMAVAHLRSRAAEARESAQPAAAEVIAAAEKALNLLAEDIEGSLSQESFDAREEALSLIAKWRTKK